ncbi:MAG: tRNA glutamyl-Q(34) synthetase GluQRS [Duncaniella sp.]|nr:tRNA glutamyl-Q(34) synthetase GluQRS [Duncaniella sp.]
MNGPTGRFAPSPSGRMHFGNIVTALATWLSVKSRGGRWILRIEDLDPQRSKETWMSLIEDDLRWLGLSWDEGGMDDPLFRQSNRSEFYQEALRHLITTGMIYPCSCTRAEIMATQAPHQSDGRIIYGGRCRPAVMPDSNIIFPRTPHSVRLFVPDETISFTDGIFGEQTVNLSRECGDFILRRSDGAWAYQLAVVVDDALMGVDEVMRGSDLLLSAAQQILLYDLLGYRAPRFIHLPLICNSDGRRLSKRDGGMSMDRLRLRFSPEQLLGKAACVLGLRNDDTPVTLGELLAGFDLSKIKKTLSVNIDGDLNVIEA